MQGKSRRKEPNGVTKCHPRQNGGRRRVDFHSFLLWLCNPAAQSKYSRTSLAGLRPCFRLRAVALAARRACIRSAHPRRGTIAGVFGGVMSYIRGASADESQFPTLLEIKSEFGFIPNFYRAQTLRPDLIDAEAGLVSAILVKEGA